MRDIKRADQNGRGGKKEWGGVREMVISRYYVRKESTFNRRKNILKIGDCGDGSVGKLYNVPECMLSWSEKLSSTPIFT